MKNDEATVASRAKDQAGQLLGQVELFHCFNSHELIDLLSRGQICDFDPGVNVVIEGEDSRGMFLILAGRVSVYKNNLVTGEMHRLTYLSEGDTFGELSL